jgi:hypothetical protein
MSSFKNGIYLRTRASVKVPLSQGLSPVVRNATYFHPSAVPLDLSWQERLQFIRLSDDWEADRRVARLKKFHDRAALTIQKRFRGHLIRRSDPLFPVKVAMFKKRAFFNAKARIIQRFFGQIRAEAVLYQSCVAHLNTWWHMSRGRRARHNAFIARNVLVSV